MKRILIILGLTLLFNTSVADVIDDKTDIIITDMFGPTVDSFVGETDLESSAVITAVSYICGYRKTAVATLDLGYLVAQGYGVEVGTSYYLLRSMVKQEVLLFLRSPEYDCPLMGEYIEMRIEQVTS